MHEEKQLAFSEESSSLLSRNTPLLIHTQRRLKRLQPPEQVPDQDGEMDVNLAGVLWAHHHRVKAISMLTNMNTARDLVVFTGFLLYKPKASMWARPLLGSPDCGRLAGCPTPCAR